MSLIGVVMTPLRNVVFMRAPDSSIGFMRGVWRDRDCATAGAF